MEIGDLVASWGSVFGLTYQVQRSTDLRTWVDIGSRMMGTGESMRYADPLRETKGFLRVVVP